MEENTDEKEITPAGDGLRTLNGDAGTMWARTRLCQIVWLSCRDNKQLSTKAEINSTSIVRKRLSNSLFELLHCKPSHQPAPCDFRKSCLLQASPNHGQLSKFELVQREPGQVCLIVFGHEMEWNSEQKSRSSEPSVRQGATMMRTPRTTLPWGILGQACQYVHDLTCVMNQSITCLKRAGDCTCTCLQLLHHGL